jgi:hypothetical protein
MQRAIPAAQEPVARHTGRVRITVSVVSNGMDWVGGVPDAGIALEGLILKFVPELKLANTCSWKRARVLQLQLSETIVALAIKQWDKDSTWLAYASQCACDLG